MDTYDAAAERHDPEPNVAESNDLQQTTIWKKMQNAKYLTFLFIGIGLLWPWNCILSASLYFKHDVLHDTTIWAKIFTSSMMTVSTTTSSLFNIWLAKRQHSYSARVVRGLLWEVIVFLILGLVTVSHSALPLWLSFSSVMVLVAVSSIATAMTQNGIMAIANVYGSEFSHAVMVGQAVAGVLPSVVLFVISFFGDPSKQSASGILVYFLTTNFVAVIAATMYRANRIDSKLKNISESITLTSSNIPFGVLYDKLKYLVLSIFTTFVVTLIFPLFANSVTVKGLPLANSQYVPFIFTIWNLGDLHGRVIADWPKFRSPDFRPSKIFAYSILRILFVPLFLFFSANGSNENSLSILQDLLYVLVQYTFGLTNGHVISLSFMKVPEQLSSDEEREAAGGFTNVFVSTGLTLGSVVSYLFVFIIASITK